MTSMALRDSKKFIPLKYKLILLLCHSVVGYQPIEK